MQYFGEILGIGTPELIIVLVLVLLLFGGRKLPELSRSIGSSIRELRKGVADSATEDNKGDRRARQESNIS